MPALSNDRKRAPMPTGSTDQCRFPALVTLMLLLFSAFTLGCKERSGVSEQRIREGIEPPPSQWEGTLPASSASTETRNAPDTEGWVVPDTWRRSEQEHPMRLATFEAPAQDGWVEIAITRFPGRVGGELANTNRWRGQMGLAPITDDELPNSLERFTCPAGPGYIARLANDRSEMLAIAVYETAADRTWFVRATDAQARINAIESATRRLACSLPAPDAGAPR